MSVRVLSLALASAAFAVPAMPAWAQQESVVYSFEKTHHDGQTPVSHMLIKDGVLYGTTEKGGAYKFGTVFELKKTNGTWRETILYAFPSHGDGAYPKAGVIMDSSGKLYGSTERGGTSDDGIVFSLTKVGDGWSESVLHSFGSGSDGSHPEATLHQDLTSGDLYGTTYDGGPQNCGVVFQMVLSGGVWKENVLFDLGASVGCNSQTAVKIDSLGNLYDSTVTGGQYGYGNVFELTPSNGSWTQTVLHNFQSGSDGAYGSELDLNTAGIVYGVTSAGGTSNDGVAYQLEQSGGVWKETILHDFTGGSDGMSPYGLLLNPDTNVLYGTTQYGGTSSRGTVFSLTQNGNNWTEDVIHSFGVRPDGAYPLSGLGLSSDTEDLYGTTSEGGSFNRGTVIEIIP